MHSGCILVMYGKAVLLMRASGTTLSALLGLRTNSKERAFSLTFVVWRVFFISGVDLEGGGVLSLKPVGRFYKIRAFWGVL